MESFNLKKLNNVEVKEKYLIEVSNRFAALEDLDTTNNKQTNSMVRVRERTIPTERPPLVGEVIANFCG
jgi:hypothetical protein